MENSELDSLIKFANNLADKSGDIIRKHFRNLDKIDCKDDASPVTIADRDAEQAMRRMIQETYSNHGIQGEEFGAINSEAQYKWIIDPIDGTLSFMTGRPIFGTLVALLKNNLPILGVIDQPVTNERWIAASKKGTSLNGKKVNVKPCDGLQNAVIATTAPNYFNQEGLAKFNQASEVAKHTIYGGDCYLYALVASGFLDAAIDSGLKPHDFLPIIPIIKEAGGNITDWTGGNLTPESNGDIIVSGDNPTHDNLIDIFNK